MDPKVVHTDARAKILRGARTAYEVAAQVYGPTSGNVALEKSYGPAIISHDGVTVMREVKLEDPVELFISSTQEGWTRLRACQLPTGISPCTSLSANSSIMLRSYSSIVSILSPWMPAMRSRRRVRVSGAGMSMA